KFGPTDRLMALAFSRDGQTLVARWEQNGTFAFAWDTGKSRWELPEVREFAGAFSPDGKSLITTGWEGKMYVRDTDTGAERLAVEIPSDRDRYPQASVTGVAFLPNATTVVTVHSNGSLRFWDLTARKQKRHSRGHDDAIRALAVSPDGKW